MKTLLIIHLCTILSSGEVLTCKPSVIKQKDEATCLARAEHVNMNLAVPRTYKGDKPQNEEAMVKPTECVEPKKVTK